MPGQGEKTDRRGEGLAKWRKDIGIDVKPEVDEELALKAKEDAVDARNQSIQAAKRALREQNKAGAVRSRGRRAALLDQQVQRILLDALLAGNTKENACALAGISAGPFHRWMNTGAAMLEEDERSIAPEALFYKAVKKAEALAVDRNVKIIRDAGPKAWQASAWWLERTRPREWGRREAVQLSGDAEGAPLTFAKVPDNILDDKAMMASFRDIMKHCFGEDEFTFDKH